MSDGSFEWLPFLTALLLDWIWKIICASFLDIISICTQQAIWFPLVLVVFQSYVILGGKNKLRIFAEIYKKHCLESKDFDNEFN